jgi:hypothetical protein
VPDNLESLERMGEIVRDITPLAGAFYIRDFIPSLSWLDLQGIRGRMKKVQGEFDALIEKVIETVRQTASAETIL